MKRKVIEITHPSSKLMDLVKKLRAQKEATQRELQSRLLVESGK